MVKFGLPSLPVGSTIESVTLHVYVSDVAIQNLTSKPLQIHRITSSWTESGVTWNSKPSFNGTSLDSVQYSALSDGAWATFDVPVSVVEGWYANPSSNYGLLLKRNPDSGRRHHDLDHHCEGRPCRRRSEHAGDGRYDDLGPETRALPHA